MIEAPVMSVSERDFGRDNSLLFSMRCRLSGRLALNIRSICFVLVLPICPPCPPLTTRVPRCAGSGFPDTANKRILIDEAPPAAR